MRNRAGAAFRRGLRGPRAFTLVEVAASVAILGGVIVGILIARNRAILAHGEADEILSCTRLCAAQVAALRAGLAGVGNGIFLTPSGQYEWRITATSGPPNDSVSTGLTEYEVMVRPARVSAEGAGGDSASAEAVEPGDDECRASAILRLPAKPAPEKETP